LPNPTPGSAHEPAGTASQKVCGAPASWVLLALLVLPAAAFPTGAIAGKLCRTITMTHPVGAYDCEDLCRTILRPGQTGGRRKWWDLARPGSVTFVSGSITGAPREVHYTPRDITSCDASVGAVAPSGIVGACTIAMCGPAPVRNSPKHAPASLDVSRYNTPKPKIGPPHPDTGIAAVKPAAKGGSNAIMDRLSGDNQLPAANKPDSKASGRLPAPGGASAVAKPGAPSPLLKSDPTSDFGKCASCGKPSSTVR
jgi:hypothetical protein